MFGFLRLFINRTEVKEICGGLLQSLINCKKCSWLFVLRYVSLIQSWKIRSLLYPHNPIGPIKALTVFTICYMHIYPTNLRLQDEVYKEKHRQQDTAQFCLHFGKHLTVVLLQLICLLLCFVGNIILVHFFLVGLCKRGNN